MTATRFDIRWCGNCDKRPAECKGLCIRCYKYQLRYRHPRPRSQWDKARVINFCHCGGIARRSGLCFACARYRYIHRGQRRPTALIERPNACNNCGSPIPANNRRHGACEPCYRYQVRHGQPRPPRLWHCDPDLGWCECGQPARERRRVDVPGGHTFTMGYCVQCLEAAA